MSESSVSELSVSERLVRQAATHQAARPYYCPFCGEEDLRPHEAARAAWLCRCCTRVYTITLIGLEVPQ